MKTKTREDKQEKQDQNAKVTEDTCVEKREKKDPITEIDLETDIPRLQSLMFTTISKQEPETMTKLNWDHKANLIGEKVPNPVIHCCDTCQRPIIIYGRLLPCKHVFCLSCAKNDEKICARCKQKVMRVAPARLGSIFMCTHGGSIYSNVGCRRTYLSERDLQAHIIHRHTQVQADEEIRVEKAREKEVPKPVSSSVICLKSEQSTNNAAPASGASRLVRNDDQSEMGNDSAYHRSKSSKSKGLSDRQLTNRSHHRSNKQELTQFKHLSVSMPSSPLTDSGDTRHSHRNSYKSRPQRNKQSSPVSQHDRRELDVPVLSSIVAPPPRIQSYQPGSRQRPGYVDHHQKTVVQASLPDRSNLITVHLEGDRRGSPLYSEYNLGPPNNPEYLPSPISTETSSRLHNNAFTMNPIMCSPNIPGPQPFYSSQQPGFPNAAPINHYQIPATHPSLSNQIPTMEPRPPNWPQHYY